MNQLACAYCGTSVRRRDKEHVIPACLYPESKARSRVQRITVPACRTCNGGWSDDEAHFRSILVLAGEPNQAVTDLWRGPTLRSFSEVDGQRWLRDLYSQMRPVDTADGPRWMIYPGRDERLVRVLRKIIRGLCHYHGVATAVPEDHVWADVLKYAIPDDLLASVPLVHREPDIIQYWYEAYDDGGDLRSVWYLRFFDRRPFIGAVLRGPYGAQG